MNMPAQIDTHQIRGLALRQLTPCHKAEMIRLHDDVITGLPDPAWFFPSEEWEFDEWLKNSEAFGYFAGEKLAGFGVITPASTRGDHSYAKVLGEPGENTFDFHDVLVHQEYRGRGIHTKLLTLFEEIAHAMDGKAIYSTVDPSNTASWRNFEKAGYQLIAEKPAYDGRMRRYYRLPLA